VKGFKRGEALLRQQSEQEIRMQHLGGTSSGKIFATLKLRRTSPKDVSRSIERLFLSASDMEAQSIP
jgi:hypothetical protein